jgi:hypothetical protein
VSEARSPECRGKKTPTLVSPAREGIELEVSTQSRSAEAVFECRETLGPPIVSYGALVSVGRPRWVTSEVSRERAKVRVHVVRMGGRSRFDASRVFFTGRSQGRTVVKEGASQEEIRSTA